MPEAAIPFSSILSAALLGQMLDAVARRSSSKQVLKNFASFLQENTCVGVSFNEVLVLQLLAYNFSLKRDYYRCFTIFTEHIR